MASQLSGPLSRLSIVPLSKGHQSEMLLLCSHSHNDVTPEPQRNVSLCAVWGAVQP